MQKAFSLSSRLRSFRHAFAGIGMLLKSQHNARVHLMATVIVTGAGFWFKVAAGDWCCLVLAIMAVWSAEAMNTAFEFLADAASPGFHPLVKHAKDVAAGAVLLAAIGAAAIGVLVFTPCLMGRT
ncbi:MAG: diacylglycerol kinase family protein [Kiritimatiellia bacterium]|jgi:diacylglycerol kinase